MHKTVASHRQKHMLCAIGVDHRYDICGEIRSM